MSDILTLKGVHTFINQFHILEGVDLSVEANTAAVILGRNGAGKTTTLESVMGLRPASSGQIMFDGQDITRLEDFRIPRRALINKTKLGMIIRAGTECPRMVRASGINIKKIFTLTFCIGCLLAALGCGVGCFFLGLYPNLANDQLFNILIVVIIGSGTLVGPVLGSAVVVIISTVLNNFTNRWMLFFGIVFVLVIIFMPTGIVGLLRSKPWRKKAASAGKKAE